MNKVLDKIFTKADNGTVRLYDYDVTHLWLVPLRRSCLHCVRNLPP